MNLTNILRTNYIVLIFGILYTVTLNISLNPAYLTKSWIAIALFYISLVICYAIFRDKFEVTNLKMILGFGVFFRVLIIISVLIYGLNYSFIKSLFFHDWDSIIVGQINQFYVPQIVKLLILLSVESLLVCIIYLLLKKNEVSINRLILYLWNPLILLILYANWNPVIAIILLLIGLFIILTSYLIFIQRSFFGSLTLGLSMILYLPNLLLLLPAFRRLKGYILFSLIIGSSLFLMDNYDQFLTYEIIYSQWLTQFFDFIKSLSFDPSIYTVRNGWILFIISSFGTILLWQLLDGNGLLYKIHWGYFLAIIIYPPLFIFISFVMIILSAVYRNLTIIIYSAFIIILTLSQLKYEKFVQENNLAISYGFLITFLLFERCYYFIRNRMEHRNKSNTLK